MLLEPPKYLLCETLPDHMADENNAPMPAIPDEEDVRGYISTPDPARVVPDVSELLLGPDEISPESLLFGPSVVPRTVAGYMVAGENGVEDVEEDIREWSADVPGAKISKYDAYYFPQTPLPAGVWEYKCNTCRFYVDPDESSDGEAKCEVVGQAGDMLGGEDIHPQAWCALWLPQKGRDWFEFVTDRLEGVDGTD